MSAKETEERERQKERGREMAIRGLAENDAGAIREAMELGWHPNGRMSQKGSLTALMLAARESAESCVKALLEGGASVRERDSQEWTALHWAVNEGQNLGVVRDLIRAGADVNARGIGGVTPLMQAAMGGWQEAVEVLMEAGADASLERRKFGSEMETAAQMARRGGKKEVAEWIEGRMRAEAEKAMLDKESQEKRRDPLRKASEGLQEMVWERPPEMGELEDLRQVVERLEALEDQRAMWELWALTQADPRESLKDLTVDVFEEAQSGGWGGWGEPGRWGARLSWTEQGRKMSAVSQKAFSFEEPMPEELEELAVEIRGWAEKYPRVAKRLRLEGEMPWRQPIESLASRALGKAGFAAWEAQTLEKKARIGAKETRAMKGRM